MAKELSGYGPTAGESMGGTGANLNQQGGNNNSNSGVHWGGGSGSGNGGGEHGSQTGWGWSKTNNPDVPPYVDDNGQVRITITNGLVKTPVYGVPEAGGNSDVQGGYIPENPNDEVARKWDKNNLPREIDVSIDGFKYRVTLNDNGRAIGILRTGVRPYVGSEKAKAGIMEKINHKTPEEIYEALGFNKDESQRQEKAKQQAEDAWDRLPPNVRKFDVDVEQFHYLVVLDDYGNVLSVTRTAVRPYVGSEKAKAGIMDKVDHKTPEEIYEALGFNNEEPQRQNQAKKAAYDVFYSFSMNRDRIQSDVLNKAAELISDMGNKIGDYLGESYKSLAREIADDIKNFQGKTIRSYDDAMESLNKILSNPSFKVNRADHDALVNAWRSRDAQDIANKLGNISKAFKAADVIMKIEKVKEKSIEGYETGNWGPLMLEVESWVLSGMAASVAMTLLSAIIGSFTLPALALTAINIAGIMGISYLASYIDASVAEKINNKLVHFTH
ncbi:TPA: colicin-like pore-forming protein [Escherichia coli]|uniref:colicin-like pore-forming protein n=1 Tax=Escherichia coli TaxID=562 RepID=UPI001CDA33E8|nr:colicin-like pore-forming protein [Escherichia coli]EGN7897366.1 hypothetical protein [Escherichia coli]MCA2043858.1 colicin-like pore-forming protein [Escherichia coli]MCA2059020.1 colicin-like pore-forming protein [Escherichia coli]MCA2085033.1 colicin-like pore-forming protein [Escherichia coli]MCA2126409.1 colicin-like pore-forming protein [Escherichia coli]